MIRNDLAISYAQYREDIVLKSLLWQVKNGFYVDIGANHPTRHSVTKVFYEQGWKGINVEPNPRLYDFIRKERPRDINLCVGIATKAGKATLRIFHSRDGLAGLSTLSDSVKKDYAAHPDADNEKYDDVTVPTLPLKQLLKEHAPDKIHFMKIDVEGFEYDVLESGDWKKYRPTVICIEANHVEKDWRPILSANDYHLFIGDGLNEYYIAKECWEITERFAERACDINDNSIMYHLRDQWTADNESAAHLLEESRKALDEARLQNNSLEARLNDLENRNLKTRTKDLVKYALVRAKKRVERILDPNPRIEWSYDNNALTQVGDGQHLDFAAALSRARQADTVNYAHSAPLASPAKRQAYVMARALYRSLFRVLSYGYARIKN